MSQINRLRPPQPIGHDRAQAAADEHQGARLEPGVLSGKRFRRLRAEASREAVRCWVIKLGPLIAANLRRRRSPPTGRWHLDEMVVKIGGKRMYLWRAVDDEGEVLDGLGHGSG